MLNYSQDFRHKARDIFDLAVVIKDKADGLVENFDVYQGKIGMLRKRLETLKGVYARELKALDIIDDRSVKDSFKVVRDFLDELS